LREAARLLAAAALAQNPDAEIEYAIALFNGTGVDKDEAAAAVLLQKAARKGNPIAQNRLAQILVTGRGIAPDPVEAIKWHLVSKAGGATDLKLDEFVLRQDPETRAAGEKAAKAWIEALQAAHEPRP
jgi:TPR repeat protein